MTPTPWIPAAFVAVLLSVPVALDAGLAGAQATDDAAPAAAPAPANAWAVDPIHSVALFRIHHLKSGMFWGRMNGLEGTVTWAEGSAEAPTFDITASLEKIDTGSEKLDGNLKGPNFFNAQEFPTLTFKSTGAEPAGPNAWRVTGDMTIHGQTKPVTAEIEMTGIGGNPVEAHVGFEAQLTIKRSEFGMTWGIEKPAQVLSDEVRLIVSLEGVRAGAQ